MMATEATAPKRKVRRRGFVVIREDECKGCGLCIAACPQKVLELQSKLNRYGYHPNSYKGDGCIACGICFYSCPEPGAITVYELGEDEESPRA